MPEQDAGEQWQDRRNPCGHLTNWSEEMKEWTHYATQDADVHAVIIAGAPWFWIPARFACERTDYLNCRAPCTHERHEHGSTGACHRCGCTGYRPRYARSSASLFYSTLKLALERAVDWKLIASNPCERLKTITPGKGREVSLTNAELRRLLRAAEDEGDGDYVYLALMCSLRWSEVNFIEWADMDFARHVLSIPKSKSAAGEREVWLGDETIERLQALRTSQLQRARALDVEATAPRYVFINPKTWEPYSYSAWNVRWSRIRSKAGLPDLHFHDVKHQSVTIGARQGIHPSIMQARAGHADPTVTLGSYTHVTDAQDQQEAASKLEAFVRSLAEN